MALNLFSETRLGGEATGTPAAPLPPEALAPHFPQLEILECLGRGGMGVVYKARQKSLSRLVALKLLAPERVEDPQFAERFAREARALAALSHPNIVTVYDFGQAGGFYFLLMEFVDGANLRQLLQARKFSPEEALAIVPPLCEALQYAHERGIVHRDIKPENLLLDKDGRIKIADFGIARMLGNGLDGAGGAAGAASAPPDVTHLAGGTPGYMAPEQKTTPQRVDARADIYSLGVVFYELLTGELPGRPIEPPSRKVHIDVRLDEIVLRALEQTPERRYQQASELKTMVETLVTTPASPSTAKASVGHGLDYRSKATLFGLPLLHVATGIDPATGRNRMARGIVAIGDRAYGVIALGGLAVGGFAFGGFAVGGFAFGGFGVGLLTFAGFGLGLILALGGFAVGPIAMGGTAVGFVADGAKAYGIHAMGTNAADPMAVRFFAGWANRLLEVLPTMTMLVVPLLLLLMIGLPAWLRWRMARGMLRTCVSPVRPTATQSLSVLEFWMAMDGGNYAQSWEAAAPMFQRVNGKEDWVRQMEEVRRPLGKALSRQERSVTFTPDRSLFDAVHYTSFDSRRAAVETHTCALQPNGEWRVISYHIKPLDGMVDGAVHAPVGRKAPGRVPYVLFLLLYLGQMSMLIKFASWLPERVATHFGVEGSANGWMSRPGFLLVAGTLPVLMALLFAGQARMLRSLPAKYINIPRRDYWLAPERRAATAVLIRYYLAWLLCLMTLFFGGLHVLTFAANRVNPPHLPMDGLMLLVIVFFTALIIWVTVLLMRLANVDMGSSATWRAVNGAVGNGNGVPPTVSRSRWPRRLMGVAVVVLVLVVLRAVVVAPYWAVTDAASPDIPRGSWVLVYKLASNFDVGDVVVYLQDDKAMLGRVAAPGPVDGILSVIRRDGPPQAIPEAAVAGQVILNTRGAWRRDGRAAASAGVGSAAGPTIGVKPPTDGKAPSIATGNLLVGPVTERVVTDAIDSAATQEPQRELFRGQLRQAEDALPALEARWKAGLIDDAMVLAAQDNVEILKAQLVGNAAQVARLRLAAAEHQLKIAEAKFNAGVIDTVEYQTAKDAVKLRQGELCAKVGAR